MEGNAVPWQSGFDLRKFDSILAEPLVAYGFCRRLQFISTINSNDSCGTAYTLIDPRSSPGYSPGMLF